MVCLQYLWWRLVLCGDQLQDELQDKFDLQDELISWFLYGLGFCLGYFRTNYSMVLISEAAIAKCPFVFITAAMPFWWFFRLLVCILLKSSSVYIFTTFFLHLFYRSVLRLFFPLNLFLITYTFISSRYFSLTVFFF